MQKLRWWLVEILGDSFVVAAARGWGGGGGICKKGMFKP